MKFIIHKNNYQIISFNKVNEQAEKYRNNKSREYLKNAKEKELNEFR
jgi:hypothetical protein